MTVYFVAGPMLAGFTEGDCPKSPSRYSNTEKSSRPPVLGAGRNMLFAHETEQHRWAVILAFTFFGLAHRKHLTRVVILIFEAFDRPLIECDQDDALSTSLSTKDKTS
jgi:hypothetical protein